MPSALQIQEMQILVLKWIKAFHFVFCYAFLTCGICQWNLHLSNSLHFMEIKTKWVKLNIKTFLVVIYSLQR